MMLSIIIHYLSAKTLFSIDLLLTNKPAMNTKTILLCILLACLVTPKMLYMAELFRHGARYPIGDIYDGK